MRRARGVTRTVWLTDRHAIKVPGGWGGYRPEALLRGWMANRSEWRQAHRSDALTPLWTVLHVILVFPQVTTVDHMSEQPWEDVVRPLLKQAGYSAEESKHTSWGVETVVDDDGVMGHELKLIDFDRCWSQPRGLIAGIYYANQERKARKWMKL